MRRGLRIGNGINLGWIDLVPRRGGVSDTTPPTVTISGPSNPYSTLPIPVTFTLSESSTDFAVGDLTLGNCTVANFVGSGVSYSCDITPSTPNGTITIDIAANSFHDAAGNGNLVATQYSITSSAFIFADEFTTNRLVGSVSGTSAEPIGGLRSVIDSNGVYSIIGGSFMVSGSTGNQTGIAWFQTPVTRVAGKTLIFSTVTGSAFGNGNENIGFANGQFIFNGSIEHAWQPVGNGTVNINTSGDGANVLGNPGTFPTYYAIMLRSTGAKFLRKVASGNWILEWDNELLSTAALYPEIVYQNNGVFTGFDFFRIPTDNISVIPLISDSFNRTDGAIGIANGAGSEEVAPTGTWVDQAGVWSISSNAAVASSLSTGGIAFSTLDINNSSVILEANLVRSTGTVGLVMCYVDASNYIIAYHDGTNAKLDKMVTGSVSNVISGVAAYGAGRRLVVRKNGTSIELYYHTSRIGSGGTISDVSVIGGTKHGLYSTSIVNTLDKFVCWSIGGGTYDFLNKYINP